MGTVIGLLILIAIDWYLLRKTGLHIHKFISKKYAEYLQNKEKNKQACVVYHFKFEVNMIPLSSSVVSGVALSKIDGEIKMLLMKRVKGGFWCHVAGSIEQGETGIGAIVREFKEETQIDVLNLYNAQYLEQFYEASVNVIQLIPVFVVMCPPEQVVVLNEEHTEYKWCSLEEALELAPFPNQHAVFKHVWSYFVEKPVNALYRVDIS